MKEIKFTLKPHQVENIRAMLEDRTLRDDQLPEYYGEETIRLYEIFKLALLSNPDNLYITLSMIGNGATFCTSCQVESNTHVTCDTADAKQRELRRMREMGFADQRWGESDESARKRGHIAGKDYVRAAELFPSLRS